MQTAQLHKTWGVLVAKAWDDPEFEEQLLADPRRELAARGIEVPDQLSLQVVREEQVTEAEEVLYLPYPPRPAEELDDDDLDAVSGGSAMISPRAIGSSGIARLVELQGFLKDRIKLLNPGLDRMPGQPGRG